MIAWRETNEGKTAVAKERVNRASKKSKGGGKEKSNISSVVQAKVAKQLADKPSEPSDSSQEALFKAAVSSALKDPEFAESVGAKAPERRITANASATRSMTIGPNYLAKIISCAKNN